MTRPELDTTAVRLILSVGPAGRKTLLRKQRKISGKDGRLKTWVETQTELHIELFVVFLEVPTCFSLREPIAFVI